VDCGNPSTFTGPFNWPLSDPSICAGDVGTIIDGDLTIIWSADTLLGLDCICGVTQRLEVRSNTELANLAGFDVLTAIGGDLVIEDNTALVVPTGLDALAAVRGDLLVNRNAALRALTGLDALTTVGGHLIVRNHEALLNLEGLDAVASVTGDLQIEDNTTLPTCRAEALAYDVIGEDNVGGAITISGNGEDCPD